MEVNNTMLSLFISFVAHISLQWELKVAYNTVQFCPEWLTCVLALRKMPRLCQIGFFRFLQFALLKNSAVSSSLHRCRALQVPSFCTASEPCWNLQLALLYSSAVAFPGRRCRVLCTCLQFALQLSSLLCRAAEFCKRLYFVVNVAAYLGWGGDIKIGFHFGPPTCLTCNLWSYECVELWIQTHSFGYDGW